jgi:GxxExxY protein
MTLTAAVEISRITSRIIARAIAVHKALGPGLLEAPYRLALAVEFGRACLAYEMEKPLDVMYGGARLGCGYRLDFVVEATVVAEVKSLAGVLPVHRAQLLTYLRLSGCPAGLLLNFNVPRMKDGIDRVLNDQPAK